MPLDIFRTINPYLPLSLSSYLFLSHLFSLGSRSLCVCLNYPNSMHESFHYIHLSIHFFSLYPSLQVSPEHLSSSIYHLSDHSILSRILHECACLLTSFTLFLSLSLFLFSLSLSLSVCHHHSKAKLQNCKVVNCIMQISHPTRNVCATFLFSG